MEKGNHKHFKIYKSRWHVVATLFFVFMPFAFLLIFAQASKIGVPELSYDVFVSVARLATAYCIAAFLAWIMAVLFYKGRGVDVALPVFDVLQSFPTFAALPLATLFWGQTNFTVIFFLVITVIWPIFFSILSSLKLIRRDWQEVSEIYGLKGWNYFRYFLWPISVPGLITGSVIGLGEGWEALVATEIIVGVGNGLGNFFESFSRNTLITSLGIFGLLLLIFSINKIIWLPLLDRGHRLMED